MTTATATNWWWNKLIGIMEVTERWLNKLIDMEEVMYQGMILGPMIVMLTSFYSINLVSVMFAGHIGDLQLAAANLAHSWAVITGFSFMFGLSAVVEPLCRQAYRTRTYRMLQIHLQTSCIISFFFSIAIALLWWYSDAILVHVFHQDHDIAKEAGVYLKFLIPGLFGYGVLQNVMRFLKAQSILDPMFVFLLASLVIHIAYHRVCFGSLDSFNHITWNYGFSFEPFHHIVTNLKLALPSAAMGLFKYPSHRPHAVFRFESSSPELQTRAENPGEVRHVVAAAVKLTILFGLDLCLALLNHHVGWAGLFSNNVEIIKKFASMIPLLLISFILDFSQGILSGGHGFKPWKQPLAEMQGVARGCGWQRGATCINLATLYFIGMPIAGLVAFKVMDRLDMWSSYLSFRLIATDIIAEIMETDRGLNKWPSTK
ncbi:hypothetical protein BC332_20339 [Capsicum chinense]|nr:hypothetical protein BC332_20339 [Capsicum chinense]